jgi:hypothetical protein
MFNPDYEQQPRTKRKNITGNNSSRKKRFFLLKVLEPKGLTGTILHRSPENSHQKHRNRGADQSTHQIDPNSTNNQPTNTNNRTNRRPDQRGKKPTSAADSAARSLTCGGGGGRAASALGLDAQHLRRTP